MSKYYLTQRREDELNAEGILDALRIDADGFLQSIFYNLLDATDEEVFPNLYEILDEIVCSELPISQVVYYMIDSAYSTSVSEDHSCKETLLVFKILKDAYKPDLNDVVYFIKNSLGRVKIGFTGNIKNRLNSLVNSSGDYLEVMFTYSPKHQTAPQLEAKLHAHYKPYRLMGEWFQSKLLTEDFSKICTSFDT